MIDEKKLIEEILEHKDKIKSCDKRVNEVYELAHDHIIDIINIQPKTDWIPCEERLPNKGEVVLAQYHRWSDDFQKIVIAYIREDDEWKIDFGGVCNFGSILAWQPLPQPYKKEGAE